MSGLGDHFRWNIGRKPKALSFVSDIVFKTLTLLNTIILPPINEAPRKVSLQTADGVKLVGEILDRANLHNCDGSMAGAVSHRIGADAVFVRKSV